MDTLFFIAAIGILIWSLFLVGTTLLMLAVKLLQVFVIFISTLIHLLVREQNQ